MYIDRSSVPPTLALYSSPLLSKCMLQISFGQIMAPVAGLKRSKIWDHFSVTGECKYCLKKMKNIKVFNLWRHMKKVHPDALSKELQQSMNDIHVHVQDVELELYTSGDQAESYPKPNVDSVAFLPHQLPESPASLGGSSGSDSATSGDDLHPVKSRSHKSQRSQQLTDALLFMIVKDSLSTHFVEGEGFRAFMAKTCIKYRIPDRKTIKRMLDSKFVLAMSSIKERLVQVTNVAIAIEVLSDASSNEYLIGFTGHFVQDFQLKSQLLGLKSISENDSSDRIRAVIQNLLVDWGVGLDKVVAFVCDSDSGIAKVIHDTFLDIKVLPCFALLINRLVQAELSYEVSPIVAAIIEKVRLIVTYLRKNTAAANLLNRNQELAGMAPVRLKLNNPSQWMSSFVMLQRFVEVGEHVVTALLVNKDAPEMLDEIDLIITKEVLDLLKPFVAITDELCREPFTSRAKVLPMIRCLKCELSVISVATTAGITFKNILIESVSEQFAATGSVALDGLTTLLDPRYKNLSFEMSSSYDEAVAILNDRLNEAVRQLTPNANNRLVLEANSDSSSIWKSHDEKVANYAISRVNNTDMSTVVARYLETPTIPRSSDPLVFWQQQQYICPALSNLAAKYLCIPATSMTSDRLFTKSRSTFVRNRSAVYEHRAEKVLILGSLSFEEWNKLR